MSIPETADSVNTAPEETKHDENTVQLDTPIQRGKQLIETVTLRKPCAGELRGIHLAELLNLDVNSLIKVIPRISSPGITAPEAAGMDPADLLAIGGKVVGFLLQKQAKTDASLVA
ncbi:phage tail assembly protein [Pseudomonas umsongensis]|uniref:phage tail assembly protein n=1 Tax=Pseudomonas umsongensis TaxID=198618 RepID=UPI001246696B|nr:phage tail assembly protein [Pseudomonas umsongensis]QFG28485.1 phage tail assembly protein [Pseudomonas umsongensis]